MPVDELDAPVSILVSVSKRRFKRAVKRNRVKRRVREAYRLNKQPLLEVVEQTGGHVAIAFIYLSDRVAGSDVIAGRMRTALQRIGETLAASKVCEKAGGAKE